MAAFHYALITRRSRLSRGGQCAKASGLFYKGRTDGYGPRRGREHKYDDHARPYGSTPPRVSP